MLQILVCIYSFMFSFRKNYIDYFMSSSKAGTVTSGGDPVALLQTSSWCQFKRA